MQTIRKLYNVEQLPIFQNRMHDNRHLFGGRYIYVVADIASLTVRQANAEDLIEFLKDFGLEVNLVGIAKDKQFAIWGGASKGVIFCAFERKTRLADRYNHRHQSREAGEFFPGKEVRAQSPREALATLDKNAAIFLMNSTYMNEIMEMTNNEFEYIGVECERF